MISKEILSREKKGYFCLSNIFIKSRSNFPEQHTFVQQSEECPHCCSVQSSVIYFAHRFFRVWNAVFLAGIITVLSVLYVITLFICLPTVSFATCSLMFQNNSRYSIYYEPLSRFLSPLTNTAPSYLLLILFCRPGLRNHRISPVLITTGGGTWRTWSTHKNHMQRKNPFRETQNPLTA